MFLIIDTSDIQFTFVGLIKNKKLFKIKASGLHKQSEKLLFFIDKILKENKASLKDVKGIACVIGPGGFTALRIGVVTANALIFALKLKSVGIKNTDFANEKELVELVLERFKKAGKGEILKPFYGKEPNITIAKK